MIVPYKHSPAKKKKQRARQEHKEVVELKKEVRELEKVPVNRLRRGKQRERNANQLAQVVKPVHTPKAAVTAALNHLDPRIAAWARLIDAPWDADYMYDNVIMTPPITDGLAPCFSVPVRNYSVVTFTGQTRYELYLIPEGIWSVNSQVYTVGAQTINGTNYGSSPFSAVSGFPGIYGYYRTNGAIDTTFYTVANATNGVGFAPLSFGATPLVMSAVSQPNQQQRMTACAIKVSNAGELSTLSGTIEAYQLYDNPVDATTLASATINGRYRIVNMNQQSFLKDVYYPNCDSFTYASNGSSAVTTAAPPCRWRISVIGCKAADTIRVELIWFGEVVRPGDMNSLQSKRVDSIHAPIAKSALPEAFARPGVAAKSVTVAVAHETIRSHPTLSHLLHYTKVGAEHLLEYAADALPFAGTIKDIVHDVTGRHTSL